MSIRTDPKKAVPSLVRRLTTMERDENLEKLMSELNDIKGLFSTVKKNEQELLDTLTDVNNLLRTWATDKIFEEFANRFLKEAKEANKEKALEYSSSKTTQDEKEGASKKSQVVQVICQDMNHSTRKLLPDDATPSKTEASGKTSQDSEQNKSESMNQEIWDKDVLVGMDDVLKRIQVSYDILNLDSKLCMLSLSVFPENAVIKRRHAIYWWIGEGFVKKTGDKTAEEVGEGVFNELLSGELILPYGNGKCPVVNKFKIHPWIRQMLVSSVLKVKGQPFAFYSQTNETIANAPFSLALDKQKVKISDHNGLKTDELRTVFNVGASYLSFGSQGQGLSKMNKLVVLQLGRWQDSPSHHIEVDSEDFLKDFKAQKYLKYLSLRGISRITELHSIAEISSLEILDLKACHNLEKLPENIAAWKKLTHLDVSQCYLLESMPKEIEKLTELQVLKGFVIGNSSKTQCNIEDLAKLKKLTRLSIHIGSEAVVRDEEFQSLEGLSKVRCLKISWGNKSDIKINFPPKLEKLDLEGYPREEFPEWLKPSNLPRGLKKLYIKGGKLKSMNLGKTNKHESFVEILRVKYLNNLKDDPNLRELFPSLRYCEKYWEKTQVLYQFNSEWSIEDEGESKFK